MRLALLALLLLGGAYAAWSVLQPSTGPDDGLEAPPPLAAPTHPPGAGAGLPEMRREEAGEVGEPSPEDRIPMSPEQEVDWAKLRVRPDGDRGVVTGRAALAMFRRGLRVRIESAEVLAEVEALEVPGVPPEGIALAELMPRLEGLGYRVEVEPPVCMIRRVR